jgi:hypothetical protein
MKSIIILVLFLVNGLAFAAAPPTVDEIVNRSNLATYYQGKDGIAKVTMIITDSQQRERERKLTILRRDQPDTDSLENGAYRGNQKFYVYFSRPADINKTAFLVWKNIDLEDDRWMYLPALDLVKRIAASDKRTSFVGSDFFYEDVSGRDIDEDSHELVDTTDKYYVIKNTPKDPAAVEFSYFKMYIHKETFIPVQVEFFDKQDMKYRVARALKVETIQGYPTVTKSSMENLKTGSKTVMEYTSVKYDSDIPEDIFSERYLRKAPRKFLK